MNVYCFDFDGVICDSAREMAWSGWHATAKLWPHLCTEDPSDAFMHKFVNYRPLIETGYQSILLTRMIRESMPEEQIASNFPGTAKMLMDVLDVKEETLIDLFASERDQQIEENEGEWLEQHSLYRGVVESVNGLIDAGHTVCIITTKQTKYAKLLAKACGLKVPGKLIFGLEAGKKSSVLKKLANHPQLKWESFGFFEDRLATLEKIAEDEALAGIDLYFCSWGYTTEEECRRAAGMERIHSLSLDDFISQFGGDS